MSPFKGIILDLFNTIIDFDRETLPAVHYRGLEMRTSLGEVHRLLTDRAGPLPLEAFLEASYAVQKEIEEEKSRSDREILSEERFARILARLPIGKARSDADLAGQLVRRHMQFLADATVLRDDNRHTLEQLSRNWRLGLLTNFDHGPTARQILARHGIEPHFDEIVISAELGFRKPSARAFGAVLAGMDCPSKEAAYVGDSPTTDIDGAKRAGLYAIWKRTREESYDGALLPPDRTILELGELLEWAEAEVEPRSRAGSGARERG